MEQHGYYKYLSFGGADFFTVVLLPHRSGRFPTVISRSPYVGAAEKESEQALVESYLSSHSSWLARGYAVVFQHCRGQGKSTGAFVPYIHEREDGLALQAWIREQRFYNGELFLIGGSYTASLHYTTAPFAADIKGAVFEVQDSERYRLWYRNGQMRRGHANWHFGLYKPKCSLPKSFGMHSFAELPLSGLSQRALGETAQDFEQMLEAESPTDGFWRTRFGGAEARGATDHADIPMLLTTGYNDFYVGGMFRMWEEMDEKTKQKSAMLVSPYDHGDGYHKERGLFFENGKRRQQFGSSYPIDWFDHIRTGAPLPFAKGVITYYRTFEERWQSDFYATPTKDISLSLGEGVRTFAYDPQTPPAFEPEGYLRRETEARPDVITVYTPPFAHDVFVRGRMRARLRVSSDAEDTSFYMNVSIRKEGVAYLLRHDVTSLGYQLGEYRRNDEVTLDFCFDEHAFLIKAGESLRIDIASTDSNTYVPHTNRAGRYYLQTDTDVAHNKVFLAASQIILPVEEE